MSHKLANDTICDVSSQSATFSSDVVDLAYLNQGSFQVVVTTGGGVTWTASVQASNDNVTFIDVTTPTAVTASASLMLPVTDIVSRYYKVVFTRTAGTLSTAVVVFVAKG